MNHIFRGFTMMRTTLALVTAFLLISLANCGRNEGLSASSPSKPPTGVKVLLRWHFKQGDKTLMTFNAEQHINMTDTSGNSQNVDQDDGYELAY